ncbi:unnamed protein product, partial [Phaeothamnion confervicola]
MADRRTDLITRCVEVLRGFNPKIQTVDSYAEDSVRNGAGSCSSGEADADAIFIKQVLYGCVRYKECLKVFLCHYYNDMAASVLRSDYGLYTVLGYLLLFRLDELGLDRYKVLTRHLDPTKNHQLLTYLTDFPRLDGAVTANWLALLDLRFIGGTVVGGLKRAAAAIAEFCAHLEVRAYGVAKAREEAKARAGLAQVERRALTVPQPFALTRPNPRAVPTPTAIQQCIARGPDPLGYLERVPDLAAMDAAHAERLKRARETTEEKYRAAEARGAGPFRLHETRSNLEAVRAEVEEDRRAELRFDATFVTPLRFRTNAAAVLREDALIKRRQAADERAIRAYESELRDSSEFFRWQSGMRAKDMAAKAAHVERQRDAAAASAAAARRAMTMRREGNADAAARTKEEKDAMREQRSAEEELVLARNRRQALEIAAVRETAPRRAIARLKDHKQAAKTALVEATAAAAAVRAAADAARSKE